MAGFFHTLIRPDHEDDPEMGLIAQAANVLQIGEFQLLQLAYFEWHGEELSESEADQLFRDYMLRSEVPAWGRHYARRILRQDEIDLIDAADPAYHRYDRDFGSTVPKGARQFTMVCAIVVTVMAGSILIGHLSDFKSTSILPPYFDSEEFGSAR